MNEIARRPLLAVVMAGLVALSGCSQEAATSSQAATASDTLGPEADVAAVPGSGAQEPSYAATLAEGIDFARPGYPEFITGTSGISGAEAWGRWTDASLGASELNFRDPLPDRFTLKLKVRDFFGLNAEQLVSVRVGTQEQSFILSGDEDQVAELLFESVGGSESIGISVPNTSAPTATDARRIGLGLVSLSISE